MNTVGVDLGARAIKVLLLRDGVVVGRVRATAGFAPIEAARHAVELLLEEASMPREQVNGVIATGAGASQAAFADTTVTGIDAAARGARELHPGVRTIIDVGAEDGRGIRLDTGGRIEDFTVNERCAAGAGTFTETMARLLEIPLDEMGPLSLTSGGDLTLSAQCAVFAESEVVSLLHSGARRQDIARAVHEAIASRTASMVGRIGVQPEVVLVGGLARNVGFVDGLTRRLGASITVAEEPDHVGALGAALLGTEER
jgi:predicted CoA-substrate-specific enzyme activase